SLVLSNFSLTLAGHTFTASDAQSAPTIQFANGEAVGITFEIDTSGVASYAFTSLSMSGWNFTAVPPVGDPFIVADAPQRSQLTIDFKDAGGNPLAYNLTVKVETQSGTIADKTFQVPATTSAGLRDSVYGVLKDIKGLEVEWISDTRLIVKGTKDNQLKRVQF